MTRQDKLDKTRQDIYYHNIASMGRMYEVWDAGTCGTETRDFKHRDAGDAETIMIIEKVGGKCDISHFPREYVLVKATHPALLRVPSCLFTKRRLGEDPLH